ncbi:uncharacterized protein BDZ99DRAFT_448475 [Mytilinidion resinicola]|uniref:N-acetyltransferase domain-containing protein n=1 Tax=Mytilinidion resinicola TaxID=574789 RepID=A0A6A6YE87_9PEZI|nr:uncharacterized protein BDZ99DRAFT_448475 [Mytilinidion resinicola]KAF2806878.1 hypothetical protein BDZ99DRAFT_448475 [Mytilinidion resinicola]
MSSTDKVYEHLAASPLLLQALRSYLPYSIPLYRRIQVQVQSPTAHILATFPPAEQDASAASQWPKCFAACYFDRSSRPETEMWVFVSGEVPGHASHDGESASQGEPGNESTEKLSCPTCTSLFLSTLRHASTFPLPPIRPENQKHLDLAATATSLQSFKGLSLSIEDVPPIAYLTHLLIPTVVTLGTLNSKLLPVLMERHLVREEFPGLNSPCGKFIFKVSGTPPPKPLLDGLRWGEVRPQDIEIVQAGTAIPRAAVTLLQLKSLAVFPSDSDKPIAWAFLGHDGSLSSLHVKPEFRGRGIAKSLASKLFRDNVSSTAEDEEKQDDWAHADVYEGNVQSESVCKSLGGRPWWTVYWMRLDLGRL